MLKISKLFIAAAFLFVAPAVQAETLSNDDIVTLSVIGLGDEAIVAKIQNSSNQFELSTDNLVALKQKGVSSAVIAAMLDVSTGSKVSVHAESSIDSADPMVPHPSGIYILADWLDDPKMIVIDATTSNQTKTGGFLGYALTGGIASMSFKTVIPNSAARVKSPVSRPVFYFYFDEANRSLSNGAGNFWQSTSVTSPNEFSLVKFKVKKNRREAKVGKFNIAGAKSGVMDKDRIPFSYERVASGVFKVSSEQDLNPGEYGFLYSSSTGGGIGMAGVGATTAKIFDFSIPN